MGIAITEVYLYRLDLKTRMPFRYGIATMTDVPHLFVEVVLGTGTRGVAADHLPPKWFTKDAEKGIDDEIQEMLDVIRSAADKAKGLRGNTFFDLWRELYTAQDSWATENRIPSLLAHFGTSLMERALLDALCREAGAPLAKMIKEDRLGLRLDEVDPAVPRHAERSALPARPVERVLLRHTVGLADPLSDEEIPDSDRLHDGLPQSLSAVIQHYGIRHFKIKVQATPEATGRLERILACIEQHAPKEWEFSLDANESFQAPEEFRAFWEEATSGGALKRNLERLLFVEQPLHRDVALDSGASWSDWSERPLLIIDESDGDLGDGARALELGYEGVSHKNCKGVVKGIVNRCRIEAATAQTGARPLLMSGEDLANIGPIAMPQDLAVQSILGNTSVERNGHHYFRGLAMFPESLQRAVVEAHPDLYGWNDAGFAQLRVEGGVISARSVLEAPFGANFDANPAAFAERIE